MLLDIAQLLIGLAWNLLLVGVLFSLLEWAMPARPAQRRLRPRWATDLMFFLGQQLLFGGGVTLLLGWLSGALEQGSGLSVLRRSYAAQPLWLQTLIAVTLGDMLMYWGHRLQHRYELLWRFHAVHHTSEHLDFLAAYREHPLDGLYTQTLMNLPAIVLGLRVEAVLGVITFRSLWAIFIHSNVRLPLGPLRMLFGAPELHHHHHARDREAGNYANLAPWIDWLFGTYHLPAAGPAPIGIREPHPRGYLALLWYPFSPRRQAEEATAP